MQNSFGWLTISQILMPVKLVLHFTLLHLCSAFLRFFVFADLWGSDECGFGSLKMRLMGFNWRKSALTFFESLKWVFVCWNLKERVTERNLNEILSSLDSQQAWIHTLLYAYPEKPFHSLQEPKFSQKSAHFCFLHEWCKKFCFRKSNWMWFCRIFCKANNIIYVLVT